MTTRLIIGIAALACVSICGLVGALANFEMVDKVNSKLPQGEQFAELGWYWSKHQRIHCEYKRLYPDGRLLFKVRVLMAVSFACLIVCAWGFGLFAK